MSSLVPPAMPNSYTNNGQVSRPRQGKAQAVQQRSSTGSSINKNSSRYANVTSSTTLGVSKSSTVLSVRSPAPVTPLTSETNKHGPSIRAPSRSPRSGKNGVSSSGIGVTHVVRVTVLGLAGITVDHSKCKESSKDAPAVPSRMRAVVAFSRNSAIRGTTSLSKPLARSPNDDIIMTGSSVKSPNVKDYETYTTNTVDPTKPQRHVAVWTSENATLGSVVTFDANLHRSESFSTKTSTFAPKSFEMTIALTEDDNRDNKVALPFGIATIVISGDECKSGHSIKLDLPVLRLQDAKPLSSQEYPMIAIAPKDVEEPQQKKKLVQRLFQRSGSKVPTLPKYPSMKARNAFWSAYTMDADGDAIIRVSLEVYEKGSALERFFVNRRVADGSVSTVASLPATKTRKGDTPYDESKTTAFSIRADRRRNSSPYSVDDNYDGPSDEEKDSDSSHTGHDSSSGGSSYTDNDSYVRTQDDKIAFFHWNNGGIALDDEQTTETDQYTLSFEKKAPIKTLVPHDDESLHSFTMFGNTYRFSSCGAIPKLDESSSLLKDLQDDMTHVTADFLGKSYQVPICATFVPKDDDTLTTLDQTIKDQRDPRFAIFADKISEKFCRGMIPKEDLDLSIVNTFSTLSEGVLTQEFKKGSIMKEYLKKDLKTSKHLLRATPSPSESAMNIVSYEAPLYQAKDEREEARTERSDDKLDRNRIKQDLTEKRSTTDASPKGVSELIPNFDSQRGHPSNPNKTPPRSGYANLVAMMETPSPKKKRTARPKSFVDIFNCQPTELDYALRYEPYQTEVPPLINPLPNEEMSIGDLTATTHEMHIATEAKLLENARKVYNDVDRQERKGASRMTVPLPVAFGGDGMCMGVVMSTSSTASSPLRVESDDGNSLVMKRIFSKETAISKRENYFAEYDEFIRVDSVTNKKLTNVTL